MPRHHPSVRAVPEGLNTRSSRRALHAVAVVLTALLPVAARAQTFSASGATAAAINPTVEAFRAALGPLNLNVAGSFGSGRREINWDGVPDASSAPSNLPANFFNATSPRGVVFSTPGTGFQVSANAASGTPVEFGNINATYPGLFAAFSAQRLFTSLGSNITDVDFFVPGSLTPAGTTAFGAIFTDVDVANTTSITFFDMLGNSLGKFFALSFAGNETFSFLGVNFGPGVQIGSVRIAAGNSVLASSISFDDVVAMDDFIYAEPMVAQVVPEPATVLLLAAGLAVMGIVRRRRIG